MAEAKLYRTKTFWSGIAMLAAAAGGYYTHTMDPGTAIQTALGGLATIFMRAGIAKAGGNSGGEADGNG